MEKEKEMTIGEKIEAMLAIKGMTKNELCEQAKTYQGNLSNVISGKALPSLKMLYNIAEALDTTPAFLLGEKYGYTETPLSNGIFGKQDNDGQKDDTDEEKGICDFETEYYKIHRLIARNAPNMSKKQKRELVIAILDDD